MAPEKDSRAASDCGEPTSRIRLIKLKVSSSEPNKSSMTFIVAGNIPGRTQTLALAWRPEVKQVRVHTCSLDHPAALPSYLRAGFVARGRAFESFPDPRLTGLLREAWR